jgi:PBP1b-binding outer membrane lipoprotein LpoB
MKNFSIHLLALFSALFFAGCSGLILCEHCSQKFGPDWEQVIMDKRQEMSRLLKSGDSAAVVILADAYKYKG